MLPVNIIVNSIVCLRNDVAACPIALEPQLGHMTADCTKIDGRMRYSRTQEGLAATRPLRAARSRAYGAAWRKLCRPLSRTSLLLALLQQLKLLLVLRQLQLQLQLRLRGRGGRHLLLLRRRRRVLLSS